ncbi:MAG: acyltransferase [Actinomycetota bacterium]|nr:acyltransferase [Actinomycetota bacterium]
MGEEEIQVTRRFPLFDSLRAIAALGVLVTHAAFISGAVFGARYRAFLIHLNVGVTVFFLISGFLLYRPYVAARRAGEKPTRLRDYAARRFTRIFPAYWLALAVLAIVPGLYGITKGNWWAYYGLLQIYPIFDMSPDCVTQVQSCGLVQTWSLAIELSFYALLPLFAFVMARITAGRSRRTWLLGEAAVLAGLGGLSLFLQVFTITGPSRFMWMHATILSHFAWFALGMGLAVASVALSGHEERSAVARVVTRWPSIPWLGALGLFVFVSLWLPRTASPLDFTTAELIVQHLAFGVLGLLLLLPAVFGDDRGGLPRRIMAHPVLLWLGRISYGIFLWHLIIAFELADHGALDLPGSRFVNLTLLTLVVTSAVAAASYYLVERPLMRLTHRRKRMKRGAEADPVEVTSDTVPDIAVQPAGAAPH